MTISQAEWRAQTTARQHIAATMALANHLSTLSPSRRLLSLAT